MKLSEKVRVFRERFDGRPDVYGREHVSQQENGKKLKQYFPHCKNFWSAGCHIRLKDNIPCARCEIQQYAHVTDDVVKKHIRGEEAHIYYVLRPDGKIKFGAIDFDYKPGKEHMGYTFEDVRQVQQVLNEWGIAHAVARSTGNGYHLYIFFEDECPANAFRTMIIALYEQCGFLHQMRCGQRPIPEIFPKQSFSDGSGIGNGIKPPMIEPNWEGERNGFVDENDNWIKDQWEFLNGIPRVRSEQVTKVLEDNGLDLLEEAPTSGDRKSYTSYVSGGGIKKKWQPPLTGSIEKVLEGCSALRTLRDKAVAGKVLGHHEGFALYHMCMGAADGLKWFEKNVPGWGKTEKDRKQLEYSLRNGYNPYTCQKMQEVGVCVPGTRCFAKKPPIDIVHGRHVPRTDIPKEQWPEPSPIRYAYAAGEDFLLKLQAEVLELKDQKDEHLKEQALASLIERAQVFDDKQQKAFKKYVRGLRLVKAQEFNKMWRESEAQHVEEIRDNASQREDSIVVQGNIYQKLQPHGYGAFKMINKKPTLVPISATDVNIMEERIYQDDDQVIKVMYHGRASAEGIDREFEIESAKWHDNSEFNKFFGMQLGTKWNILRQNIDLVRQASAGFSERDGVERTAFLVTQGWYNETFLVPSVIVDRDGFRPNTEQHVDLGSKEHARRLDFKLLSDADFKETMFHIKSDLFNAWPRMWTFFGISHTLLPVLFRPLGIQKKPALFYEGLTGAGKTDLTRLMQYFWGDFDSILNLSSTGKGIMSVAHDFKDALLVIDDYKGATHGEMRALEECIQRSYDPSSIVKLRRDSSQMAPKSTRGLLMFSGERFLSADAAKVARTIIIEVEKQNTKKTRDKYRRCWQMCKNYRGIIPRFLHWALNQDLAQVRGWIDTYKEGIFDRVEGRQNADRVAFNLALNYTAWRLWVDFMLYSEVTDRKEAEELLEEHWGYVELVRDEMISRCEEEQDSTIFVRVLKELLLSGEATVHNLEGFVHRNKPTLGFVNEHCQPGRAYFFPDLTYKLVRASCRDEPFKGSDRSIARQLVDAGVLVESKGESRRTRQVRFNGHRVRVWEIDLEALGIRVNTLRMVGKEDAHPYRPEANAYRDIDGIM